MLKMLPIGVVEELDYPQSVNVQEKKENPIQQKESRLTLVSDWITQE